MIIKYFYQTEAETVGPLSFHGLWLAAQDKKLRPHDSVRIENTRHWVRADSLAGLFTDQEPPTDIELIRAVISKRQQNVEEAIRARNEALLQAGLPPDSALPYELTTDYPGSDFELMQPTPRRRKPKPAFQPRPYPMIELGITLLYILGTLVLLFGGVGMIMSLREHGERGLPLFVMFLFVVLAGIFQFVIAAILAAYIDLLSDTKRTADAVAEAEPPVKSEPV